MRRGGRMRGRGRNQPARQQQIRPLMSEQIENIDLELELLKQKREMIEQHQLMLENKKMYEPQRTFNTDKPRYYEQVSYDAPGPSRSEWDFAQYYDDPVAEDYIPLSSGRKRPADAGWPRGSSPKRFGSRRGNVAQAFGSRLGPKPSHNANNPSHGDYRQGSASKSAGKVKGKRPPQEQYDEDCTLRPDCVPSHKVKGRLEYAFGTIMKQMRENFADKEEYMPMFKHNLYSTISKAALRERIRSLMLHKVVSHGEEVITLYRNKYPVESDVLFMKKIWRNLNAKTGHTLSWNDDVMAAPVNPVHYIKNEMGKVMDAELNEIIRKLEIINNPKLTKSEKEKRLAMESIEVQSIGDDERDTEEVKLWKREVHKKIRQKMPKVLMKNVPSIIKFLHLDLVYINTWTALMSKTKDGNKRGVHKLEVGIEGENAFAPVYRAKVRGHPKLPPKIREFLEPFKPMWVKRHKIVRSVVYVQFREKEELDELLKQNGVHIGDVFLRITGICKKNENSKNMKGKSKASKQTRRSVANKASKENVNKPKTDLDNQIDDLLSSIRQAEEAEPDLNEAMIELKPEIKMEKENDVNASQNETIDVTTEGSNECGKENTDVNEINEKSDITVQDAVNVNTGSDTNAAEQNVGDDNATGDPSTEQEHFQAKRTEDKEAGDAGATDVEKTDREL